MGNTPTAESVSQTANLQGKTAIVTGANTGIGKEIARVIALRGAHVIIACRDKSRAESAMADIRTSVPNASLEFIPLDLSSLQAIKEFVAQFNARNLPLHILINNAGMMMPPSYGTTVDGFETTFGVNHVGPFALTLQLIDNLKRSSPSRVIVTASRAHRLGSINFDDINCTKSYSPTGAYYGSKYANVMFASELDRRLKQQLQQNPEEKFHITVNSLHPGIIKTDITRDSGMASFGYTIMSPFLKSIAEGAATSVYLATSEQVANVSGKYFMDCVEETPKHEEGVAARLWDLTEQMTGVKL